MKDGAQLIRFHQTPKGIAVLSAGMVANCSIGRHARRHLWSLVAKPAGRIDRDGRWSQYGRECWNRMESAR